MAWNLNSLTGLLVAVWLSGTAAGVVQAQDVELEQFQGRFGYSDWPNWVPVNGNVGRLGTDFSQFRNVLDDGLQQSQRRGQVDRSR